MKSDKIQKGFTLVEVLVGTAVFLTVAMAVYSGYMGLIRLANAAQARVLGVALADEQFEIVRNLPYVNVGLTNGIPLGVLPQTQTLVRGGFTFTVTLVVRNIDLATSSLQASNKLVEVDVACASCQGSFTPISLTGQISPANLQSAATGGALVIQVFDSGGVPIQGATVVVQSTATSSVTDTDTTNDSGVLEVIGVPPGVKVYRITVSKQGYSSARTYPMGGSGNPNPTQPDLTVAQGQVTQASFAIDKLSVLNFSSVSPTCQAVPNLHFTLTGAKQIGAGVPKYSSNLSTDAAGSLALNPMEWDTYTITPTDASNYVNGITPFSPVTLNAGNTQSVQFIAVPASPNSLQVSIADNGTSQPLSGASVELSGGSYDQTLVTGQGYFSQTDWSGGGGQASYTSSNRYFGDDGGVDTSTSSGNVVLKKAFGSYAASGRLESSTFDTGTSSNFYSLNWKPSNQPPLAGPTPVSFQFAVSSTSNPSSWSYLGPDGTSGSYFTVPGTAMNAIENGNEYARYMMYLSTATATVTPSVSDMSFAYTSSCLPPGQVIFQGLSAGNYTLTVSKTGYTSWSGSVTVGAGWQNKTVKLGL